MHPSSKQFLFNLLNTPSPTGFELPGMRVWAKEVKKYADTVKNDAYGNTWATRKGKTNKVLLLEAHADEIGYIVKHIAKNGFISVDLLGGSDAATARGRRVTVYGDKGEVQGIITNIAIHIRDRKDEKVPQVHELTLDIGAKDDKEVASMGIRIGHPMVYSDCAMGIGKHCITGRAIDNRLGGFIIAEVMKNLSQKKELQWTIVAANAVQEEIGCYGARMLVHSIAPDAAVCFDVTHATDSPGIKPEQHGSVAMNKGPTVTHAGCNHPLVVQRVMDIAKKNKIPFQHEAASRYSGTDTGAIYFANGGIPSALVSLPIRYMHSAVEMMDLRDVEKTIKLLTAFCESLSMKDDFAVKVLS